MMKQPWMFVSILAAAAVPWAACSSSSGSGTTSTATTGSGAHTTSSGSASHAASSGVTTGSGGAGGGSVGTGGANACMGIFESTTCVDCLTTSCCGELAKCNEDSTTNCVPCETGDDTSADCTASPTMALIAALNACQNSKCLAQCPPPPPPPTPSCDGPATAPSHGSCFTPSSTGCNPVTNAGCTTAGDACDVNNGSDPFACFDMPANTAAICAACDLTNGPACLPGGTCVTTAANTNICAQYCCDDGDCGSGTCDKTQTTDPSVGICVVKGAADAGPG